MIWDYQIARKAGLATLDAEEQLGAAHADTTAIPFKVQKACLVHGPFIPCTDDCPRIPATYTMKRDGKRGARLRRCEDGRMAMPLNYPVPQGTCFGIVFSPGCVHAKTEKLADHDGKVELYCVACGKRYA